MNQLQHGDVNLQRIASVPDGAKKVERENGRYVLMRGETTGHAHTIEDEIELFENDGVLYMRNASDVEVTHEEHKTLEVPAGIWEVTPTHEYDHFAEAARKVMD
jgi:hypothetical protein